jgi:hypothetical protein
LPTVLRLAGLRVAIYSNDHRPAHVHVIGGGCEAVFDLRCPEGPPALRENYRFSPHEVSRIAAELAGHLTLLCEKWREIHDQP